MNEIKKIEELGYTIETYDKVVLLYGTRLQSLQVRKEKISDLSYYSEGIFTGDDGQILKLNGKDIYRDYYSHLSDEQFLAQTINYSLRTYYRLNDELRLVGFIKFADKSDDTDFKSSEGIRLDEDENAIIAYNNNVKLWVLRIFEGDEFTSLYFDQKPSAEKANKAITLLNIRRDLKSRRFKEDYNCIVCNQLNNWLDVDTDIFVCYEFVKKEMCKKCDTYKPSSQYTTPITKEEINELFGPLEW